MVQYVEIYMERVRDLLDPTKQNLSIREDKTRGIYIQVLESSCALFTASLGVTALGL